MMLHSIKFWVAWLSSFISLSMTAYPIYLSSCWELRRRGLLERKMDTYLGVGLVAGGWGGSLLAAALPYLLAPSTSPHSLTHLLSCVLPFVTWTLAHQAPLSMEFSRQEYCSGCHFLLQGDLPDPKIKPMSPALPGGFFTPELPGKLPQPLNLSINTFGCPPISRS